MLSVVLVCCVCLLCSERFSHAALALVLLTRLVHLTLSIPFSWFWDQEPPNACCQFSSPVFCFKTGYPHHQLRSAAFTDTRLACFACLPCSHMMATCFISFGVYGLHSQSGHYSWLDCQAVGWAVTMYTFLDSCCLLCWLHMSLITVVSTQSWHRPCH